MYRFIRPLLFLLPPESAHALCLKLLDIMPAMTFGPKIQSKGFDCMGLHFKNRVGLAAGFDKDAQYISALSKLHFGFIEVGTVTPRPQDGNLKPRLFRLTDDKAIINRMGFNNKGVLNLVKNLEQRSFDGILGINIGKNKDTPLSHAHEDYAHCLEAIYPYADYVTINISSPNTPDLRKLQQEQELKQLLDTIEAKRKALSDKYGYERPILVKVSPDESDDHLKRMVDVTLNAHMNGFIATNTTSSRHGLISKEFTSETGGLSGAPLKERSTEVVKIIRQSSGRETTIIAVGGIDSPKSLEEKMEAGADLFQVYTGLIYEGPSLIKRLVLSVK